MCGVVCVCGVGVWWCGCVDVWVCDFNLVDRIVCVHGQQLFYFLLS